MKILFKISLAFVFLLTAATAEVRAQADTSFGWHHALIAELHLAEVSFTHWTQGGVNALSYIAGVNGQSIRNEPTTNWTTSYKLDFGQTRLDGQGLQKTDDEINLESVLMYKLGAHVNPYAAVSLLTQFAPGYQYSDTAGVAPTEVSNFFDPAYIKESAGAGWVVSKAFQTRLGLALREIITNHFPQYASEPLETEVKKVRIQGGLESESEAEIPVDDNVLFRAKVDLFSPFNTMDRIVVHGEGSLIAKVSKVFSAELSALFINEPDISPYTQIKQGLSLGISYAVL
ncbi:MAG TPA: DUF3078 domain-containing protein [Candidatus Kapabacteria bacterium]|nr:DUF3078 domain-containing protein [Candidatus Kapabacteria bacterium]